MSALEMLDYDHRIAEPHRFQEWLDVGNVDSTRLQAQQFLVAVSEDIYGPVVATAMEYTREHEVEPEVALAALQLLCKATTEAEYHYTLRRARRTQRLPQDVRDAIKEMQTHMAIGEIAPLTTKFAMPVDQGKNMAIRANRYLRIAGPIVQGVLAEANYSSYFSDSTMSTAERMLETELHEIVEGSTFERMSHVDRSNYAIGQLIASFVANKDQDAEVIIMDQGMGSGATTARIVKELSQAGEFSKVSISGNEPNPDYFNYLKALAPRLTSLLPHNVWTRPLSTRAAESGPFVNQDILSVTKNLDNLPASPKDVVIVDANFVWHRLPTPQKSTAIKRLDEASSNLIFVIADMGGNQSDINRRYFNFGNNGPLNAGNLDLESIFEKKGFQVRSLHKNGVQFSSIHPKLAERIKKEASNDGYLWVACKGPEAERLVSLA